MQGCHTVWGGSMRPLRQQLGLLGVSDGLAPLEILDQLLPVLRVIGNCSHLPTAPASVECVMQRMFFVECVR